MRSRWERMESLTQPQPTYKRLTLEEGKDITLIDLQLRFRRLACSGICDGRRWRGDGGRWARRGHITDSKHAADVRARIVEENAYECMMNWGKWLHIPSVEVPIWALPTSGVVEGKKCMHIRESVSRHRRGRWGSWAVWVWKKVILALAYCFPNGQSDLAWGGQVQCWEVFANAKGKKIILFSFPYIHTFMHKYDYEDGRGKRR